MTLDDKMKFLRKIHDECGIKNIEMESLCFIAMCNRAGIKCEFFVKNSPQMIFVKYVEIVLQ